MDTQNEQLEDHKKQFAKFDKKEYWIRIADCAFSGHIVLKSFKLLVNYWTAQIDV